MRIIAISPFQNSSVAILNDGVVESFCREEEFTNIKNDSYPFLALEKCISTAKGTIDVALICSHTQSSDAISSIGAYLKKMHNITEIIDISDNYHLQLASLAFYNSQFDKAVVLVINSTGSIVDFRGREAESIFLAEYPANFKTLYQSVQLFDNIDDAQGEREGAYIDSSGRFGVSKIFKSAGNVCDTTLTFDQIVDLSAYGRAEVNFTNLYKSRNLPNKGLFHVEEETNNAVYLAYKNNKVEDITKENCQEFADFAFQMQIQTQDAISQMLKIVLEQTGVKKVCIAGDFASNACANAYYKNRFSDVEFYFEPLYDGNAVGGAYFVYRDQTQDSRLYNKKMLPSLVDTQVSELDIPYCQLKDISTLISKNKSVAVFDSKIALSTNPIGTRNIIVNACDPDAKNMLRKLTKAPWYQAFGAFILKDDVLELFNTKSGVISAGLNLSFTIKPSKKELVPGLVHADNTCRLMIIEDETSFMYKMLVQLKKLTGVGAVLTADFTDQNNITVSTAPSALNCFDQSAIDAIWFPEVSKIKTKN